MMMTVLVDSRGLPLNSLDFSCEEGGLTQLTGSQSMVAEPAKSASLGILLAMQILGLCCSSAGGGAQQSAF